jgi:hypothetical protein
VLKSGDSSRSLLFPYALSTLQEKDNVVANHPVEQNTFLPNQIVYGKSIAVLQHR